MTPIILPKATLSSGSSLSLRSVSLMPASCSHPGHHPGLRCSPVSTAVKQMPKPTPTCGSSPQREILFSLETSHILASNCIACGRTDHTHPRSHKERQLPLSTGTGDLPLPSRLPLSRTMVAPFSQRMQRQGKMAISPNCPCHSHEGTQGDLMPVLPEKSNFRAPLKP